MTIEERATTLVARLDREIARVEAGTIAVGGLTKVGNDLEALLKAAASAYCRGQGSSLDSELRRRGAGASGAGAFARLLKEAPPNALANRVSEVIARDLRGANSRVSKLVELRNANAHDGADLKSAKTTLAAVAALLRPLLP